MLHRYRPSYRIHQPKTCFSRTIGAGNIQFTAGHRIRVHTQLNLVFGKMCSAHTRIGCLVVSVPRYNRRKEAAQMLAAQRYIVNAVAGRVVEAIIAVCRAVAG